MAVNRVALLSIVGVAASALLLTGCATPEPVHLAPHDVMDFHTLFADNCQGCHGVNGEGGAVQRLNDPVYLAIVPKEEMFYTIANGRPGTLMPAFSEQQSGPLTIKQIHALVDGIKANWGKPRANPQSIPPYFAQGPGDSARGLQVFNKACSMCHGPHGPVGPITIPSFLSLISDQDLRTIVIIGRPKMGMPDWRNHGLGRPMTNEEITDVVAYLSSLRPQPLPGVPEGLAQALPNAPYGVTSAASIAQPGTPVQETGTGQSGAIATGNQGSGFGPGSPVQRRGHGESNKNGPPPPMRSGKAGKK